MLNRGGKVKEVRRGSGKKESKMRKSRLSYKKGSGKSYVRDCRGKEGKAGE